MTPALLIGALILIVCIAAVRLSTTTGLPSLLLYLGVGLLVGEGGLGIQFEDQHLTQVLGYAALILILTEGGFTTRWASMRRAVAPALVLSTLGVVISVLVVGSVTHVVLHLDWTTAMLVGAIVSSTDAAAVFSVLRNVPLPRRLSGLLEAESGFNDAPVVLLVVALSVRAADPATADSMLIVALLTILELAGGAAVGLVTGALGGRFLRGAAAGSSGLFSIGVVAVPVLMPRQRRSIRPGSRVGAALAGNMALSPHLRSGVCHRCRLVGPDWATVLSASSRRGIAADPARHAVGSRAAARAAVAAIASVSWFGGLA